MYIVRHRSSRPLHLTPTLTGWRYTARPPRRRWRRAGSSSCAARICRGRKRGCGGRRRTRVRAYVRTHAWIWNNTPPPVKHLILTHVGTHLTGLAVLRKLVVRPKRGQAPLFAVYTLCHANARFRTALTSSLLVDPPPAPEEERAVVGADGVVIETLAVRMAGLGVGGRVPRTEEYRRVMDDMNMPDND